MEIKYDKDSKTYSFNDNKETQLEQTETYMELLVRCKNLEKEVANSIPISLIEKKIEDYKERKRYYEDENLVYDDEYYSYEIIIQVLQELLDERNNTDER